MEDLQQRAIQLRKKFEEATPDERIMLEPQINRVIETLKANGQPVPTRLRGIQNMLREEEIDSRFDNMPV